MGITWPETSLDVSVNVSCPCTKFAGSLAGRAFRYCGGTTSQILAAVAHSTLKLLDNYVKQL